MISTNPPKSYMTPAWIAALHIEESWVYIPEPQIVPF